MTIRLFVSDVDGTLVGKDKKVTDATVAAVDRLRAAGVDFTVISARPMSGMLPIAERLSITGTMGAFNGGLVFRLDGSVLEHITIDTQVARDVLAMARDTSAAVWIFTDDRWYASDPNGPHTASERITANQEPVPLGDPYELLARADKITFVSDDEAMLSALEARVSSTFGDQATIALSQPYYLDVTALGADKGAGIERLSADRGLDCDAVAAVGDQANDLPMLARAALPIAMGNAPGRVRDVAKHITLANDADGVAHAIDTIILPGVAA